MTKRKLYSCRKIKNYANYGKSKANLLCEHGIPEVRRHSWMNEECKSHLLVYSTEGDIRLGRKKTGLREVCCVKKCLYMWLVKKGSESVPINGVILKAKAVLFNRQFCGSSEGWLWRWKV
jgi:hypothetical protein